MVINLSKKYGEVFNPETDVYIGRACRRFKQSIWANPFVTGKDGTREEVIEKYETYLLTNPQLMAKLPELQGKRLCCWCSPKPCHVEVLLRYLEMLSRGEMILLPEAFEPDDRDKLAAMRKAIRKKVEQSIIFHEAKKTGGCVEH